MPDSLVLLLGDANIDVVLHIDRYPQVGGDARSEFMSVQVGGSAANTSITLAKLGVDCALLTRVGDDLWARRILEGLRSASVDTGLVGTAKSEPSGLMFIPVTPAGERTIFGRRGANRLLQLGDSEQAAIQAAPLLHLSGYAFYEEPQRSAAFQAMEIAHASDTPISLDTAYGPALEQPDQLRRAAREAGILVLGEQEARSITGADSIRDAAGVLRELGPDWIAMKRGSQGARLIQRDSHQDLPASDVEVVDTTGAGDAFSAGIIFGWLNGWELIDAGLLAVILGGLATTVSGAGLAFPDKHIILAALRDSAHSGPFSNSQRQRLTKIASRLGS